MLFLGAPVCSVGTASMPCSSSHIRSPGRWYLPATSPRGHEAKSIAVETPESMSDFASLRPMPHTSRISVSLRASCRWLSDEIMQHLLYPAYFLAKLAANLANVFVGAMPMLTGIPVHCATFFTTLSPHSFKLNISIPSKSTNASSTEY